MLKNQPNKQTIIIIIIIIIIAFSYARQYLSTSNKSYDDAGRYQVADSVCKAASGFIFKITI